MAKELGKKAVVSSQDDLPDSDIGFRKSELGKRKLKLRYPTSEI